MSFTINFARYSWPTCQRKKWLDTDNVEDWYVTMMRPFGEEVQEAFIVVSFLHQIVQNH